MTERDEESTSDEKSPDEKPTAVELTKPTASASESTEVADVPDQAEVPDEAQTPEESDKQKRRVNWGRVVAYGILPGLVLVLVLAGGYFKYVDSSARNADTARAESVQAAKDGAIAILSYTPDKVADQLGDARNLLTGDFQQEYTDLTNKVVIPGAQQEKISAVATVPAVAPVSADANRAEVLVFVNQQVVVGDSAPTDTASSVRVTLQKDDGKWLISAFDPI